MVGAPPLRLRLKWNTNKGGSTACAHAHTHALSHYITAAERGGHLRSNDASSSSSVLLQRGVRWGARCRARALVFKTAANT